ncbi:MAG: DUF4065 domain-containing protein [Candidatus Saccharimonas sp.]|nr:MAG: DUF4065 domain-containing protein [Candidatus Saccharimonas sp.]
MKANKIAAYFVKLSNAKEENDLTNLKLQKILYFAQGVWLGENKGKNELFSDEIEAWKLGPVVREVYSEYAVCGASPITELDIPEAIAGDNLSSEIKDFLDKIWDEYGKFSASYLVSLTHQQTPWIKNYKEDQKLIISKYDLASFFVK